LPTPGDAAAPEDASPPSRAGNGAATRRYRLPGPLSQRGELPVAPGAPRIPRALRAFNGMPQEELPPAEPLDPVSDAARRRPAPPPSGRPREPLTIRDLLEEAPQEEFDEGPLAGLRTALRRLRRGSPN